MSAGFSNISTFELNSFSHGQTMEIGSSDLSTDLADEDGEVATCTATIISISVRRVRIVVSLVGKLVLPAVVGVYYAYLRNQKSVLDSVKRQVVPAIIAFLTNSISKSLSSVQGAVTYPSNRIDPLLKIIKYRYRSIQEKELEETEEEEAEKCVNCDVLSEPTDKEEIRADVIFIHGLHGSIVKTWRQGMWQYKDHKHNSLQRRASTSCLQHSEPNVTMKRCMSMHNQGSESDVFRDCDFSQAKPLRTLNEQGIQEPYSGCWPKDWLPNDCPGVRVIAVNYTTDPYLWRPVWIKKRKRTSIEKRSKEMMEQLLELGVGKKPIVWVGHSKGGLYIKQMLVNSWENAARELGRPSLHALTKAIMFYSVPHMGASLADFNLPFMRRSVELLEIRKDCAKVQDLQRRFLNIFRDEHFQPEIFSFIETSFTFMSFIYLRIVAKESADPGIGEICWVPLDHREICKPRSRNCFLYQGLVDLINKVA